MQASRLPFLSRKSVADSEEVVSYRLMTQAGFIIKHGAGLYTYGPLAFRLLETLKTIVRRELDKVGCIEISMPFVQPAQLWQESGRWDQMGAEMARLVDRKEASYCLAPTHEEVVTDVFRQVVTSYKQLPTCFYQINPKFRDEIRPRFGLMRAREFLMMDAYSFHETSASLDQTYDAIYGAYQAIFRTCGVRFEAVEASVGNMGGHGSHEFHILAATGEDEIFICESCKFASNKEIWVAQADGALACPKCSTREHETHRGIEAGHIFKLGTKYTDALSAKLLAQTGKSFAPTMGCYGIGVSRVMAAVIEQHHDAKGMIWPAALSPIDVSVIPAVNDPEVAAFSESIYRHLAAEGARPYWDDRDAGFGQKIRDWELMGFPHAVVIGKGWRESGEVELFERRTGTKQKIVARDPLALARQLSSKGV